MTHVHGFAHQCHDFVCYENTKTLLGGGQPAAIDSECHLDIQYFPCRGVLQQKKLKRNVC